MVYTLTFGKYKGKSMEEVYEIDASYVSWLADKSYVAPARRAAEAVIAAQSSKDAQADVDLLASLRKIAKAMPHPHLKAYRYIHMDVRRDYASIDFATQNIFTAGGFVDGWDSEEDWDIVAISTYHEGLDEIDEDVAYIYGHEYPTQKPRTVGPAPTAEAAIWFALRSQDERNPLNTQPVTLAEAIELLEHSLTTK